MKEDFRTAPIAFLTQPRWFALILLALSASLSFVYADRSMPIPDEGATLTAAVKILRGGVFYRDIDAYVLPGVPYLLAGAMSVFGEHLSVARALAGSLFCAMVLGVYACALALVDRRRAALCGLSLLCLKFFAFPIYTMIFYADASLVAAILALAIFLRHRFDGPSARLVWVGVLAGLSITMKQSTGIYVAAVFAVVLGFPAFARGPSSGPPRRPEILTYAAGLGLVLASISTYFASQGLLGDMLRSGLLRPFTDYLPTSGISIWPTLAWWNFGDFPSEQTVYLPQLYYELVLHRALPGGATQGFYLGLAEFASRLVYLSLLVAFGASALLWLRSFRETERLESSNEALLARARFFSAAGISLAILISAFPRADFIHIMTVYPVVVLVLFALGHPTRLGRGWRNHATAHASQPTRRRNIEAGIVVAALLATSFLALRYDSLLTQRLSIERADLWIKPQEAWLGPLITNIQASVPEGDPLFVYGHEAQWYFLSDRFTTWPFAQVYPGMTGDDTGEALAMMIRESRPPVIVQGILAWKGMTPILSYTPQLARTITELYEPDTRVLPGRPSPQRVRIWRLRDGSQTQTPSSAAIDPAVISQTVLAG